MQTETRALGSLELPPPGLLSLAMTALRLTVPARDKANPAIATDRVITLEEVSWHDNERDCWVIVYDRVYDLTDFLNEHPGGHDILLEHAGRDATVAFRGVGHSSAAVATLDRFLVGELPHHERIFRTPGGIQLSDIPK